MPGARGRRRRHARRCGGSRLEVVGADGVADGGGSIGHGDEARWRRWLRGGAVDGDGRVGHGGRGRKRAREGGKKILASSPRATASFLSTRRPVAMQGGEWAQLQRRTGSGAGVRERAAGGGRKGRPGWAGPHCAPLRPSPAVHWLPFSFSFFCFQFLFLFCNSFSSNSLL